MAFQIIEALQYADEVVNVIRAVKQYKIDREKTELFQALLRELYSAIRDTVGEEGVEWIDGEKWRQGAGLMLESLEPLFDAD